MHLTARRPIGGAGRSPIPTVWTATHGSWRGISTTSESFTSSSTRAPSLVSRAAHPRVSSSPRPSTRCSPRLCWTDVPQAPQRRTKLLVARSPHGRVAVATSDESVAAVIDLADGKRTLEELAVGTGVPVAELRQTLEGLVDLGAVRFSTGS